MSEQPHWVAVQEKAFSRWLNDKIKVRGMHVENLSSDMTDGLALCNLLEVISGKSLGRWNKHPVVPMQKVENACIALNFLQAEGIKLVNIGPEDVAFGRQKLILGLIWTIILRYQIAGMGEDNELKAKTALLEWVRSKIPEYNVTNFTTSWNDGRAICGLCHALDPAVCSDHRRLDPADALNNARKGIETGRDTLGVAELIEPAEMINPKVDERAVMTYIAMYRDLDQSGKLAKVTDASKCRAYGSGLENGVVGTDSEFVVEVPKGCKGLLEVRVEGPKDHVTPRVTKRPDGVYEVHWVPTEPGTWHVYVTLDKVPVPGSPFTVTVLERESLGGEGKIRVFYSTTSCKNEISRPLQELLESKGVHLRPDFEPWIAVDVMEKDDREAVFRVAGTRKLPIVYIDDQFVGSTSELFNMDKTGELDRRLKATAARFQDLYGAGKRSQYLTTTTAASQPAPKSSPRSHPAPTSKAPAAAPAAPAGGKFCAECGKPHDACARFCAGCGSKL